MTKEQLEALEDWIVSIIREEDRASDAHEVLRRRMMREDVEKAFGLRKDDGDDLK